MSVDPATARPTDPATARPTDGDVEHDDDVKLYGGRPDARHGPAVLHVSREEYVATVKALADDGYTMCASLTAVDYLEHPGRALPEGVAAERFEVVATFLDLANRRRRRLRVQVPADDATLPTLFDVHPGTEAMEREVFDMFGVSFTDHPDMTRILMPEDWDGHPLRKDYPVGSIPVQFKAADGTGAESGPS